MCADCLRPACPCPPCAKRQTTAPHLRTCSALFYLWRLTTQAWRQAFIDRPQVCIFTTQHCTTHTTSGFDLPSVLENPEQVLKRRYTPSFPAVSSSRTVTVTGTISRDGFKRALEALGTPSSIVVADPKNAARDGSSHCKYQKAHTEFGFQASHRSSRENAW